VTKKRIFVYEKKKRNLYEEKRKGVRERERERRDVIIKKIGNGKS
jgi:hypothetical protein